MDCRLTLGKDETFVEMLVHCMEERQRVALLIDDNGLTRAGGFIQSIHAASGTPYFELEGGQKIEIKSIVAVNGIFSGSYSEC